VSPHIVLVHGLGRDAHDWDAVTPGLADLGECTAVDLAGFGEQGPPPDRRYSPAAHAARVADRALADAPEPVHLVGNSLGGLVSVLAAARHPEKVATLTLVAPALPLGGTTPGGRQLALLGVPGVGTALMRAGRSQDLDRRTRDLLRLTFARPGEAPPERVAALRAAVEARDAVPHADVAFAATVRGITLQQLGRPGPVRRAVASLPMPVTALYGRHDRLVPVRHAVRFKRLLPPARVRVLEHAGHLIQVEDPADVVAAVRRQVTSHPVASRS
jgi:pimeloyl-ACP methyl ester carboxylesterase